MQKLIYINQSKANAIANGGTLNGKWETSTGTYYNSLVFTNDGHLLTHGIDFSLSPSIRGGSAGNIVYLSGTDTTAFLSNPNSNAANAGNGNYILSFDNDNSVPIWKKIVNYQLTLNGNTNGSGTSLGSFYAPTSAGASGQILKSNGSGAPTWLSLTTSITGNGSDTAVPSTSAVVSYVSTATSGLTGAMHYKGLSSTDPSASGGPTDTGVSSYISGDVVTYDSKEYVYDGTNWRELGDESSYLLKSAKPLSSTTLSIGTGTIGSGITVNLATISVTNTKGNNNIVNLITTDNYGRVTEVSYATALLTDTTHNFFVGASGAKANAAVSNGTDIYLTTKLSSATSGTNGTNILGLHAGTGISISTTNQGLITFTNTGLRLFTQPSTAITSSTPGSYQIGTITKGDGSTVTLYGHDVNTWRDVKVYKVDNHVQDSTIDELLSQSIGTSPLKFSNTFSSNNNDEIDLVWLEIDANGVSTYVV